MKGKGKEDGNRGEGECASLALGAVYSLGTHLSTALEYRVS